MSSPPIALIIDTDPALGIWREGRPRDVDDGLAIVEAINSPDIELLAVTVTFGNAQLPDALRVAQTLVALKQADVPVAGGAAGPLLAEDMAAAPVQSSAMRAASAHSRTAPTNGAVDLLEATLDRRRARIAAIGPLTNLGLLLLRRPDLAQRIDEVVIVAGRSAGQRFYLGDVGPVRDFNFESDVRAARVLLESAVPIVMVGFEVSSKVVVTMADLDAIRAKDTPSAQYLYQNSLDWFEHWTKTFPSDAGFHPWDSAAIAWLRNPGFFTTQQRGWRIRDVELSADERARNPDGSPGSVAWLETDAAFAGPTVTYCTGFKPGAAQAFVAAFIADVY